jgi:hypothetical protein
LARHARTLAVTVAIAFATQAFAEVKPAPRANVKAAPGANVKAAPRADVKPAPRRLRACVVSLNEPHEVDAFRANLDPKKFEIIDIRAVAAAARPADQIAPGGATQQSWLIDACTPQTSCDVMIYSAEFAGRFFGKEQVSLSLQDMEEASCQARCAGLFRQPREVFLLACNTLATKNEDSRSPEEYLQVLLDHGFDRSSAERVVELRYGPLGPSFRESLRRVFAGVPRIYGFSSVAPRGQYTAPMLTKYLRSDKDIATRLLMTRADTGRNNALMASFKGTALTQTSGLSAKEAGAIDRDHICALYDESRPVAERLWIAYQMLQRRDALSFVPTLQVFLTRHPAESLNMRERSIYGEIQRVDTTHDALLRLVRTLNVSALKLELAHFALLVGWLDKDQFHTIAADGAAELLQQPLSAEVVDIMCEITKHESVRDDFTADDIPPTIYRYAQGLRLLSCLAPSDPRVSGRILAGLGSSDPLTRQWAVYALTDRQPLDDRVLEQLVPHLRDPAPEVVTRVQWLFQKQSPLPKRVLRTIEMADKLRASEQDPQECTANTQTCEVVKARSGH